MERTCDRETIVGEQTVKCAEPLGHKGWHSAPLTDDHRTDEWYSWQELFDDAA